MSVPESPPTQQNLRSVIVGVWAIAAAVLLIAMAVRVVQGGAAEPGLVSYSPAVLVILGLLVSFVGEYARRILGMGYGTTATGALLALGFDPHTVIPAVLFLGLLAGAMELGTHPWSESSQAKPSRPLLRSALLLAAGGLVGSVLGAFLALGLPTGTLTLLIALLLISMGALMACQSRGWVAGVLTTWAAPLVGLVAGAGKGFMGGAYGPVIALLRLDGDSPATTRATLAGVELVACAGAVAVYSSLAPQPNLHLLDGLILGSLSVGMLASLPIPAPQVRMPDRLASFGSLVVGGVVLAAFLL